MPRPGRRQGDVERDSYLLHHLLAEESGRNLRQHFDPRHVLQNDWRPANGFHKNLANLFLVFDSAGYHGASTVRTPDNVTLLRLPPYAPELNPIENVWEYLRANKLAITVFDDYDDVVAKTCEAWNFFANDPGRIASITSRTWATVNP